MTGLRNKLVLEIDIQDPDGNTRTGVFSLREDLNTTGEVARTFLMAQRGQYLRKIYDVGTDLLPDEVTEASLENRKGYHVDGGAGSYGQTITGMADFDEDPWGDGSAASGEYSKYDASGDVPLEVKKQVFEWYLAQAESDSRGDTRLHIGEWTNGSYTDGNAGVFDGPMPVAIPEANVSRDPDNPSALEVSLECQWTALFPANVVAGTSDAISELASKIPDY
jgi:hypothetical protein